MKTPQICALACAAAISGTAAHAYQYGSPMFASAISARNIGVMQHSIILAAMDTFEGAAMPAIGPRGHFGQHHHATNAPHNHYHYHENAAAQYGHMPMYGEYGDDGTVFQGRSGGDHPARQAPTMNNAWLAWRHYGDDAKLNDLGMMDSRYDLIMAGLSVQRAQIRGGVSEFGMFGGYTGGVQQDDAMEMHENGGYLGIYNGYNIGQFGISLALDAGTLYNRMKDTGFATDTFHNIWIGAAAKLEYNIRLTQALTLQPGVYAGYTWIRSPDYTLVNNTQIQNENLNLLEIAPALRAIQHIGRGWYGTLGARFAFNFIGGGKTYANNVLLTDLGDKDFIEYDIGIEKAVDRFNIAVNFGRRDLGRRGWNGGFNLKYRF